MRLLDRTFNQGHHRFVAQVAPVAHGLPYLQQGLAVRSTGVLYGDGPRVAYGAPDEVV